MKKPKYFEICPKCNSPDVGPDYSNAGGVAFSISAVRKCNNCGHTGTFFPSVSTNKLPKIKKRSSVKGQELVDRSFMKGLISTEFLTTGVILVLGGIILFFTSFKLAALASLVLGILAIIYAFFNQKYKNKWYMKSIVIIIFLIYLILFILPIILFVLEYFFI